MKSINFSLRREGNQLSWFKHEWDSVNKITITTKIEGVLSFNPADYQEYASVTITYEEVPLNAQPTQSLEEFLKELQKLPTKPFKPYVSYNGYAPDGMIETWFKADESYAEWISPFLTLHRSFETNEITGVTIDQVEALKLRRYHPSL